MPAAAPPDEGMPMLVPVAGRRGHGLAYLLPGLEAPALERQRAQHLPPWFYQVQVRCIFGLEDELPARLRQREEQHIGRPVSVEVIDDPINVRHLGRNPVLDPLQGVHPVADGAASIWGG